MLVHKKVSGARDHILSARSVSRPGTKSRNQAATNILAQTTKLKLATIHHSSPQTLRVRVESQAVCLFEIHHNDHAQGSVVHNNGRFTRRALFESRARRTCRQSRKGCPTWQSCCFQPQGSWIHHLGLDVYALANNLS